MICKHVIVWLLIFVAKTKQKIHSDLPMLYLALHFVLFSISKTCKGIKNMRLKVMYKENISLYILISHTIIKLYSTDQACSDNKIKLFTVYSSSQEILQLLLIIIILIIIIIIIVFYFGHVSQDNLSLQGVNGVDGLLA